MRRMKYEGLHEKRNGVESSLPEKMQRVAELDSQKVSSNWLTVLLKIWSLISTNNNSETPLDCGMTGLYPTTNQCMYVVRASQQIMQ